MKLPKNLQSKDKKVSIKKKEKISIDLLIQAFKEQFSQLIEKFEEKRDLAIYKERPI